MLTYEAFLQTNQGVPCNKIEKMRRKSNNTRFLPISSILFITDCCIALTHFLTLGNPPRPLLKINMTQRRQAIGLLFLNFFVSFSILILKSYSIQCIFRSSTRLGHDFTTNSFPERRIRRGSGA